MSTSQTAETVISTADKLRLWLAVLIVLAALTGYYLLKPQGPWMQWGGLAVGLVLAALLFFTSHSGKTLISFGHSAIAEGKKVVWPDRKTTLQMTLVVFVMVTIVGLFMFLIDHGIGWLVYDLILRWK